MDLLKDNPVLTRWFHLISQDVENEAVVLGSDWSEEPHQAKAKMSITYGKRCVINTLLNAVEVAHK